MTSPYCLHVAAATVVVCVLFRFVGMLPQDQLQQFIVRAVTGYGDRVQADVNDALLKVTGTGQLQLLSHRSTPCPSHPMISFLSYPILSHRIPSFLILSHLVLSYSILSYPILLCPRSILP